MNQQSQKRPMVAIITMFFLFAMIAFVTNLAAPLGTIWKNHYSWAGMLGNMMNFLAYLFMGIPAGNLLSKIGYKKTALLAMVIGIVGLVLQYLSSCFGGILILVKSHYFANGLKVDSAKITIIFEKQLIAAGEREGVEFNDEQWQRSSPYIIALIKGLLSRDLYEDGSVFRFLNPLLPEYREGLQLITTPERYDALLRGDK